MAKVFFNSKISGKGKIWSAKNGATRRELVLIVNENDFQEGIKLEEGAYIEVSLGTLKKGNHSFIFVNKPRKASDNILGVFINKSYGYEVRNKNKEEMTLFEDYSVGGPGNSCSQFGIYKLGTIIEVNTYKDRSASDWWLLTERGWVYLKTEADIRGSDTVDASVIKKELGWEEEVDIID